MLAYCGRDGRCSIVSRDVVPIMEKGIYQQSQD